MPGAVAKAVIETLSGDLDRPVISGEVDLTAGELLRRSAGFARMLEAHGCGQDSRVALYLQSNVDLLAGMIGGWMVGACVVLMDFRTPGPQRSAVAKSINATLSVESRRMPRSADDYPTVLFDDAWRQPAPWADFANGPASPGSFALCALSSGTTGVPKIYLMSHEVTMRRLQHGINTKMSANSLFLAPMSLSISATRARVLSFLIRGGQIRFMPPLASAGELIETLSATRAAATALPPSIIATMVREIGVRPEPYFPHLKMLRSTGGPALPEDKIAAYHNLTPGYRMAYSSNLTGTATILAGEDVLKRPESAGRAVSGVTIEIIDALTGARLPNGQAGLIKATTPYVGDVTIEPAGGSYGGGEQRGDDWGIPGDVGFLDDEGYLTIVGRSADMIIRGGVNVAPQEIEAVLVQHPAVIDVAVTGIDDPIYGQEIVAAIVSKDGDEDEFRAFCIRNLAPERRPRIIRIVDSLPYNAGGKLQRSKVADMLSEG
ncbi:long-chain fatty acid--CoA ligase [Aquibium carbonis]|uniref:Long-chain fatty acid--CoA ligase n=1 Tax=Aquibium carbonis TaxID=2495581 RepID=A0A429Z139_9HYPH|nr:class I adenylate-forming enzyme family protein [Aquibium carbonis]RST87425.1 long-chain fatty acid--CoA ligase [Aquibium carbonis]